MSRPARFISTLLEYDVPEIVRLKRARGNLIAMCLIGLPDAPDYLAVTVKAGDWERFLHDRCDVRYLFTTPLARINYSFSAAELDSENVEMVRFEKELKSEWLPEIGLFASELSNLEEIDGATASIERVNLDGEWDSSEFGHLQRKISDVYSFLLIVEGSLDEKAALRAKRSFYNKPLAGGSSYGSLFNDIRETLPLGEQLRLKAVQKASPGYMDLKADANAFESLRQMVTIHQFSRSDARDIYLELRKSLSDDKMLKRPISSYSPTYSKNDKILQLASSIFSIFGLANIDRIMELTEGNSLAFAKIALAFYRRVDEAMHYFAEGRAEFPDEDKT
jgi:hypothetical protein